MFPNKVIHVELVELDFVDFDVILSMDWLHDCFANEPILEGNGVCLFL